MKKIQTITTIFILSIMALTLNSCWDDDRPDVWNIVGTWELAYDNLGPVPSRSVVKYQFRGDGTGTYGYYDNWGKWSNDEFVWDMGIDGSNSIEIRYGFGERYIYYLKYSGSHLIMSDNYNFYTWGEYVPTWD